MSNAHPDTNTGCAFLVPEMVNLATFLNKNGEICYFIFEKRLV